MCICLMGDTGSSTQNAKYKEKKYVCSDET